MSGSRTPPRMAGSSAFGSTEHADPYSLRFARAAPRRPSPGREEGLRDDSEQPEDRNRRRTDERCEYRRRQIERGGDESVHRDDYADHCEPHCDQNEEALRVRLPLVVILNDVMDLLRLPFTLQSLVSRPRLVSAPAHRGIRAQRRGRGRDHAWPFARSFAAK